MTGLLARIAARTAGGTPVAAPRTPSRFEPLPEEMGLPEPMAASESAAPPSSVPAAPPAAPLSPVSVVAAAAAVPASTGPAGLSAPAVSAPALSPVAAAQPAAMVRRREAHPPIAPMTAAEPGAAAAAGPVPRDAVAAAPIRIETSAARETPARPGTLADADGPETSATTGANSPAIRAAPQSHPARAMQAGETIAAPARDALRLAAPPDGAEPQQAPASRPLAPTGDAVAAARFAVEGSRPTVGAPASASLRPSAPPPTAAAAAPPVVEIHIGSIEVRAAAAPAAPAPRSGPAPSSLDAFLAGGRAT